MPKDGKHPHTVARLPRGLYERELYRLQAELVTMQEWVRAEGARVLVLFEGRITHETRPAATDERTLGLWMTGRRAPERV